MKRKTKGRKGLCAIKLDMSKAYDRVEWAFLARIMVRMGFDKQWIDRIQRCITSVSYSFIINGKKKGLVAPSRGLRQGDPISPYLFLLCVDAFSLLLSRRADEKKIHGVQIYKRAPPISHLFFAEDSVLYVRANSTECHEVMKVISCYEKADSASTGRSQRWCLAKMFKLINALISYVF